MKERERERERGGETWKTVVEKAKQSPQFLASFLEHGHLKSCTPPASKPCKPPPPPSTTPPSSTNIQRAGKTTLGIELLPPLHQDHPPSRSPMLKLARTQARLLRRSRLPPRSLVPKRSFHKTKKKERDVYYGEWKSDPGGGGFGGGGEGFGGGGEGGEAGRAMSALGVGLSCFFGSFVIWCELRAATIVRPRTCI